MMKTYKIYLFNFFLKGAVMDIHNTNKHIKDEGMNMKDDFISDFQKVKDKACETCGAISDTANHAKSRTDKMIRNTLGDLQESTEDMQENVVQYVKSNPVKTVIYALLAGFVVSHLLRK